MALKFLNKKGWHTGSLRNIENVWKAEQKHDSEQKKLEELRKQIQEEKERSEFRLLQEQAGLVPKQERLDFLYDSGLAVGKGSDGFKALETLPKTETEINSSSSSKQAPVPGALFEEKPQSANDAWRKLHSDPLLLIRQREQEALAHVRNNPIQMAMIHKSVEAKKKIEKHVKKDSKKYNHLKKSKHGKDHEKYHHLKKSKHGKYSSSNGQSSPDSSECGVKIERGIYKDLKNEEHLTKMQSGIKSDVNIGKERKSGLKNSKHDKRLFKGQSDTEAMTSSGEERSQRSHGKMNPKNRPSDLEAAIRDGKFKSHRAADSNHFLDSSGRSKMQDARSDAHAAEPRRSSCHNHRQNASKLSDEERAARLLEMQMDAEMHEERRWKRLKKASEDDAREASKVPAIGTRNFLETAHKSVYGAEKGGSNTIEESVRRRTYFSQGRSEVGEGNAFRR